MIALIDGLSSLTASHGPSLVVKATITLVLMLVAVRLARESRAAVRHLWLTAGFAVLLALPFASALVPSVRVEVTPLSSVLEEYTADPLPIGALPAATVASSQSSVVLAAPRWMPTLTETLTAVWLGGLLAFGMPVVVGAVQVRRLRRNGLPWLDGQRVVSTLAREAGLRRPVDVALHESIGAPATCGIRRHAILFPIDARMWSDEDIVRAALHEVEHARRGDCLVSVFARVMCAVYWFHPLVWGAWRRLGLEAERACDDAVLRRADATTYADQLVSLARRLSANTRHPLLAMANRNDLVQRVSAVLNPRQARGRASLTAATGIVLAAGVLVIGLSPLQTVSPTQLVAGGLPSSDIGLLPQLEVAEPSLAPSQEAVASASARQQTSGSQIATLDAVPMKAQTPERPRFEVVSIRPCENVTGRGGGPGRTSPESGGAFWNCQPVQGYIVAAYVTWANGRTMQSVIERGTVVEGPSWLESERYSIEGKASGSVSHAMMHGPMLQALLEDRFKLKVHLETRQGQVPAYALTVAPGGARLRPFQEGSCTPREITSFPPPPPPPGTVECRQVRRMKGGTAIVDQQGITLDALAKWLSFGLDRRVINQTGIPGLFDFAFEYALPAMRSGNPALSLPDDPVAPSIHDVLQALGLQLEATNGPQEVLVIDSIERPSPN